MPPISLYTCIVHTHTDTRSLSSLLTHACSSKLRPVLLRTHATSGPSSEGTLVDMDEIQEPVAAKGRIALDDME